MVIAERHYPLTISPDEEQKVRKAANLIKQKMLELKGLYTAYDQQDFLAMASLLLCVDSLNKDEVLSSNGDEKLNSKLDELNGILTDFLNR